MGMWKWGLEATASGALVRTPVPSGVEPAVRPACRCQRQLDVVMDGETSPRRRCPTGTPPGTLAPMFRACSPCWQRSPPVCPSGCPWLIGGVDVAAPGRGDNVRGLLHVSKQDHGDDGAAGISQDIDDVCAERHGGVPGQAQRGGLLRPGRPWLRGAAAALR